MRFLLATLIALALTALPLSGVQVAAAAPAAHVMTTGDCHGMPMKAETKETHHGKTDGRACAEHCMTQVSAPQALSPVSHPGIANTIVATHAPLIEGHAPRAADPPDTPPPRA